MNNDQEIILAKISAVYDKPPFVKMETGQMEMILKCVGLGAYYDKYREYLEPYWYNGRFQNPVESYRIFVGLNSIFEDLLNERKGDEIISLLTELGNYIPGTILSDEARFAADFNKLRQLYNLMGLQIVSMEVDEYSSKFQVEPYLNEGNQIIQSFGMERWLKSKYQDVYEAYESALNSFSSGDLGAAIESCRTALTGIFSKYKGVPFQKAKWMLGMATLTGDFTGTQSADASEMTSIKNEIEAMGKRDIADFFEENLEGSYKKTKAIYSIYSMLSDYGTHRLEGTVEVAKNEDALMMIRMTTDILVWIYQKHGIQKNFLFRKMIFRGLLWRSFFFTHFCRKEEMPMATRGRKPKPTAMKELEGNPGKHPLNTSEPKPNKKAPACPKWLEPEAKKEWRRLAKQMEAIGILTEVDMAAFAGYCQAYARWKEAEEFITQHGTIVKTPSGYWQQVPQVSIAQTYLKIMNKFAEQFGLTPSSRSRIIASDGGPADAADEMENLLGGGGS